MAIVPRKKADGSKSYRVVVHSPSQGHVTIGTFSRKKDAEIAETEYKRQSKLEGVVFVPRQMGFTKLTAEWLATRRVKASTMMNYKSYAVVMDSFFGTRNIHSIRIADCELFLTDLVAQGKKPTTCNEQFKGLRRVLQYAVDCGYMKENPAVKVKPVPIRRDKQLRVIAPRDHQRLVAACKPEWATMIYVWVFLGLRRGEMFGLMWDDFDLKKRQLHVKRQFKQGDSFSELKTESSERTIYFSKDVADRLRLWKLQCPPSKHNLVFPSPWGEPISRSYFIYKVIQPLRDACNMPELKTHDFRHTFVSYHINQGADIKFIQSQCGHAHASMTLDIYGHLMEKADNGYADRLGDWYVTATLPPEEKVQVTGA